MSTGFMKVPCPKCWGTCRSIDGCICPWCTFHHSPSPYPPINYQNQTIVFDTQKEIRELKERIKKLEDWKNS